jgi:nucleoside-diphosphate-sugar epimerase
MKKNILIIGFVDFAKRFIKVLGKYFIYIFAISRHDSNDQNINKINWDWLSDEMVDLKVKNFDSVIIIPKPSSLDEKGYVEGFVLGTQNILNLLSSANINRVIAVSSTRVYGSSHKGLVDESFIEKPSDYRGELIMKYESALSKTYGPRLTILRFSGLYDNQSNKITHNKLHRDQAAKIIAHFMEYQSENSQTNIINCAEDSKILSSEKTIGNAKLKKAGFNF